MSERDEREERLSALIDGELTEDEARALRDAVESDAALRERLEALEGVDEALRSLEAPSMSSDLYERLEARIARDAGDAETPASSWDWRLPLAAAIAAALLAGWLALPTSDEETTVADRSPELQTTPESEVVPIPTFELPEEDTAVVEVATTDEPVETVEPVQETPPQVAASETPDAEDASDVELAIVFELETLRDFEVIEELDLLEALLALEERDQQPPGSQETS